MSEQNNLSRQGETWRRIKEEREAIRAERDALAKENEELRGELRLARTRIRAIGAYYNGHNGHAVMQATASYADEAQAEIRRLRDQLADEEERSDLHAEINREVAGALFGPYSGASWSDMGGRVKELRKQITEVTAERDEFKRRLDIRERDWLAGYVSKREAWDETEDLQKQLAKMTAERDALLQARGVLGFKNGEDR